MKQTPANAYAINTAASPSSSMMKLIVPTKSFFNTSNHSLFPSCDAVLILKTYQQCSYEYDLNYRLNCVLDVHSHCASFCCGQLPVRLF